MSGGTQGRDVIVNELIRVCHKLYEHGMVSATDGNVSARLEGGNILATRSGINKGAVQAPDLVEVGPDGRQVGGTGKPSTELGMHIFIYAQRPDVGAVVHAHPTVATGFAAARLPLDRCVFPEVIVGLGAVPLATYATPSTAEVAESLQPFVAAADAILLANHGVVTYGPTLEDAYFKMEKVEHAARITFVARLLGGEHALSADDVRRLRDVSIESYGKDFSGKPACAPDGLRRDDLSEEELRAYIANRLRLLGL